MKTKLSLLALGLAMVAGVGAGCQPENAGVDPAYMKTAEEAGKVNREIFVKVGGDYDKMTPEDRAKFLANFKNDEAQAKRFWDLMKNPPGQNGVLQPGVKIPNPG
jgi:hypothetical protein